MALAAAFVRAASFGATGACLAVTLLSGCSKSPAQQEVDRIVASTKSCGDFAYFAAIGSCDSFSGHLQQGDPQIEQLTRIRKALSDRWDTTCAHYRDDIGRLAQASSADALRAKLRNGNADQASECPAIVDKEIQAYPALAKDRHSS